VVVEKNVSIPARFFDNHYIGESALNNLVYIGFGLIGFGFVFFLYLVLSGKSEQDDEAEIE
jgi:hypothetical protein